MFEECLTAETIQRVYYTDAYLASPLPVILLSSILAELCSRYKVVEDSTSLEVNSVEASTPYRQHYQRRSLFHNWYKEENAS